MTEKNEASLETLKKRAAVMAAVPQRADGAGVRTEYLEFALAGESYAVELSMVREVCDGKEITRIPGAPGFMAGVANIRGQILPVADLAVYFGIRTAAASIRKIVVLCLRAQAAAGAAGTVMELGILADEVRGVRTFCAADIQPPPGFSGAQARYLGGMTRQGLIVFKAERFLNDVRTTAARVS